MEHASNGDLFDYMKKNHLKNHQKIELFLQICKAIKYVHKHGLMHRDLKPENILISKDY